jgi:AcrR family transcriptional regulator
VTGLEALSFGELADRLNFSKGGIQGLFGTKQQLQLDTLHTAIGIFEHRVLEVGEETEYGLPRLRAMLSRWIEYLDDAFEGGCFFSAAAAELDGRPGPLRDALLEFIQRVRRVVCREVRLAQRVGDLRSDLDPDQLTFELHAVLLEANFSNQLFKDAQSLDRARRAIDALLDKAANS